MSEIKGVDISIMGREFRISCAEDEQAGLMQAVEYLDRKMREIREGGKIIGVERIAIMAGLNIAHELLTTHSGGFDIGDLKRRIGIMQERIEREIAEQDDLF